MKLNNTFNNLCLFLGCVGIVLLFRIIPHPPNFTPVIAMSFYLPLFFGLWSLPFIILAFAITDYFIGFHSLMWAVYLSFSVTVVIGFLMKKANGKLIFLNSIFSAVLFFIITNFAVWALGSFYSKDFTGLLTCFSMGIPFLKNTLLSAVIFSSILFGGYEFFNQLVNKYLKVSKRT